MKKSSRFLAGLLPLGILALGACGLFGEPLQLEPVSSHRVLEFAERVEAFYGALEDTPLDAFVTFEDPELRAFFQDGREFSDYYASLAAQIRLSHFRRSRASRILVNDFVFPEETSAIVELTIVGQHERILRFWEIEIFRTDSWHRVDGVWYLTPDKL